MQKRFKILKNGRGIVVFYEITPLSDFHLTTENMIRIKDGIYVKVDKHKLDPESLFYLCEGVKKMVPYIKEDTICYEATFDFDLLHYQPEAMYYVFVQWFSEKYNLTLPEVNFDYIDKSFVFPDLTEITKRLNE